jgi:hypothetical protein
MIAESVLRELKDRVCDQIDLRQEGNDRFIVFTPFRFDDGDHFGIILKKIDDSWILTDEASTLMHLSYDMSEVEIGEGNRGQLIESSLAGFSIQNRNGELVLPVPGESFGDALFSFIQGIAKVSDITFLSRDRVRSTFLEDFKTFMREKVPEERLQFDWFDEENDHKHKYVVDARVNGMKRPLFVYALQNEDKVKDANISLLTFERWKVPFQSMAVYEDQELIPRGIVAKFTDVCDKQFSSLDDNKERIGKFLEDVLSQRR